MQAQGIEPFIKEYVAQFPRAAAPRQKMLLIDRLIHRWHWEHENNLQRPGAANLIEGKAQDTINFLNELTYSEKSTDGLAKTREAWQQKHKEAAQHRFGSIEAIFAQQRDADPWQRIDALGAMLDMEVDADTAIEKLSQALQDPNRKVRRAAAWRLLEVDVDQARQGKELVPLLLPLLEDPSGRLRGFVAQLLAKELAAYVPLAAVARAVLNTEKGVFREQQEALMRAVLTEQYP